MDLTYSQCNCELVADGPDRLPDMYCACSAGWIKEMFETVTGKTVQVERHQTVKTGADSCKFTVRV